MFVKLKMKKKKLPSVKITGRYDILCLRPEWARPETRCVCWLRCKFTFSSPRGPFFFFFMF